MFVLITVNPFLLSAFKLRAGRATRRGPKDEDEAPGRMVASPFCAYFSLLLFALPLRELFGLQIPRSLCFLHIYMHIYKNIYKIRELNYKERQESHSSSLLACLLSTSSQFGEFLSLFISGHVLAFPTRTIGVQHSLLIWNMWLEEENHAEELAKVLDLWLWLEQGNSL